MSRAVVFAYHNVGVCAAPRQAQPRGGRGARVPGTTVAGKSKEAR